MVAVKATQLANLALPPSGKKGPIGKAEAAYLNVAAKELADYGRILTQAMQPTIPQRSGELARSLRWEVHGKGTRQVALKVFIGNAKRPDVVVRSSLYGRRGFAARKSRVLRFEVGGKTVYAQRVMGVLANDWFKAAWDKTAVQRKSMERRLGTYTDDKLIKVGDIPGAIKRMTADSIKPPGMNRARRKKKKK